MILSHKKMEDLDGGWRKAWMMFVFYDLAVEAAVIARSRDTLGKQAFLYCEKT